MGPTAGRFRPQDNNILKFIELETNMASAPHYNIEKRLRQNGIYAANQGLRKKNIDMAAVMKAIQAISSEINFEKLLDQLMRIIIENAGAQRGFLILKKKGGLWIEASVSIDSDEVDVRSSVPVEEDDALALDVIRYVERTGEPVVIHRIDGSNLFHDEFKLSEKRPISLLCMPIFRKEKTTGVLYLENNLAKNVFTKERVKFLNILLAQASISLENALLYKNLKKEVIVRRKAEQKMLHLATAVEQAAEGIIITEDGGGIRYVNSAFEHITGYASKDLIGLNIRDFTPIREDQAGFKKMWRSLATRKKWKGHFRFQRKDSELIDMDVVVSPIRYDEDSPNSYVGIFRDATHEIKMERAFRQAQKMEAIGTLAGGIAHEFNNILAVIMGYTELATFQTPPESPIHPHLNQVIDSTQRAKALVSQILAFSRQTDQEVRPFQPYLVVKEALKLLRASLPSTIKIQSEIEETTGYVEADPTQINQVVMNLCTNAAQAMKDGGELMVRLENYTVDKINQHRYPELSRGPFLQLIVRDTGDGISRGIIEKIFDPFFTTKEPGEGAGMGLAMVHGIVKRCEGAVRVESEPGQGTEIRILLPKYRGESVKATETESGDIVTGRERVMFIDDEKTLCTLAEEGLQRIGYQVHLETDSTEALKAFKQHPEKFDLVITDQTMPHLTGIELSRELIKIRPDIPIILYSGRVDEISSEVAEEAGIRAFLSKPLMLKQLSEAIRQILDDPVET